MSILLNSRIFKTIRNIYLRFQDDDIPALAAQLTYYFILSFFPFLIFLITLVSFTPVTSEQALNDLSKIMPSSAYNIVSDIISQVVNSRRATFLSFGMLATIWASSNGMNAVIRGLNRAFDQKETRPFWKVRGLSVLATIALALTILFSFFLLVFGEIIGEQLFIFLGFSHIFKTVWTFIRYFIPLITMLLVFTLLYLFTPNRRLTLREVMPGSLFSTFGWILTSVLFSLYINNFGNFSRTYGSIGGVIALLIWLYWISIIILLGGELNATLAFSHPSVNGQKQ
ncbi:MAG: YihY/virulence factor BrkB family protein [Bacillota bacterium]